MARKRYSMAIKDGMLSAAEATLKADPVFNPQSVALSDFFSVDLRRAAGGGGGWKGASWRMEETGDPAVSFEYFQRVVIEELGMKHNTGQSNVQIVTVSEDEFPPGTHPIVQFQGMLDDTTKKPDALEIVPVDPI